MEPRRRRSIGRLLLLLLLPALMCQLLPALRFALLPGDSSTARIRM
jgi:hypothetical protein|tara:strand:- start:6981 stop:7118 length:138 start_codon:yes stop_codon:yes gene_type:complete